jgi:probable AcnD-accessory protein PrpF
MRGGTSKGVFFRDDWLPADSAVRESILLRVLGSPDPYGQQIDGMGGATSSTSKVVIIGPTSRDDCDVDYRFGQVDIDKPVIDWSGNCGNLTSAVGPFAISQGLVDAPADGVATVRIWQANLNKKIIAYVPMRDGEVVEEGDFELDGVCFPSAEIKIEFLDPGGDGGGMFPTGNVIDILNVPGVGHVETTLLNAGNPTIFVDAATLGLSGTELQEEVNRDGHLLQRAEAIRAHAAVRMGMSETVEEATQAHPHTPKLAFVAAPSAYMASNGKVIDPATLDINARIFSMGKLHHAMTGTGGVAIAAAAATPGTVVNRLMRRCDGKVRFGHPSGSLAVEAKAEQKSGEWVIRKVIMSRSARRLMEGTVFVPSSVARK